MSGGKIVRVARVGWFWVGWYAGCVRAEGRLLAPPLPDLLPSQEPSLGLSLPSSIWWMWAVSAPPRSGTASANCARLDAFTHLDRLSRTSQPFTGQQRCVCVVMPLLSMYINNKAGGLIYQRVRTCHTSRNRRPPSDFMPHPALAQDFGSNAGATTSNKEVNDHLLLASTFNSLAMILKELSPVPHSSKMRTLRPTLALALTLILTLTLTLALTLTLSLTLTLTLTRCRARRRWSCSRPRPLCCSRSTRRPASNSS